jgi:4-alpha-glucanotransferase
MKFPRCSGILLHPTSLPGPLGSGDLGESSYRFIDWLSSAGQSLWQMLPVGPAGMANSPYMSLSAFAGSPMLIDLSELVTLGWLKADDLHSLPSFSDHRVDYALVSPARMALLAKAAQQFFQSRGTEHHRQFDEYCEAKKVWLEDYALFQALNQHFNGSGWITWDHDLVHREPSVLKMYAEKLREYIDLHKFTQWCYDRQWNAMKKYANDRNVKLVGDIPIFVAHHSSDVWSNQEAFLIDENGMPLFVAGVPPDYFSEDGQRWGNPLYRWDVMSRQKYRWWVDRFRHTFTLFDIIRIDHFRGFEAYWEIPAKEKTARTGRWVKAPGDDLFTTIKNELGTLPIIAEDLGVVTPEVTALRERFNFPGMKILQFAFSSDPEDIFLPHNYVKNCVVFTGTHDNDTTIGWYEKVTEREREFVRRYSRASGREINWDLITLALQSTANIAVIPLQDIIGLGSEGRMNFPGTVDGNWEWRFTREQLDSRSTERLAELTALYGRCSPEKLRLAPAP